MQSKRKLKRSIWGNINGYIGRNKVQEFGTDNIAAGYWLLTGAVDYYAGYENDSILKQCKEPTP